MTRLRNFNAYRIRPIITSIVVFLITGCTGFEAPVNYSVSNLPISIIPRPASTTRLSGEFILSSKTVIIAANEPELRIADHLNRLVEQSCGFRLEVFAASERSDSITLIASGSVSNSEEYSISIEPGYIQINGTERGLFYAVQSFAMLIPSDAGEIIPMPAVEIKDAPRFRYRGMHLDVARHFMPVEFLKKYIELLSRYKFNYFHLHLTDDQGWRIEIKKYPRLAKIGSNRKETVFKKHYRPYIGDGIPVHGFYSRDDILGLIEFAKSRYVIIIPEIDFPGHSSSALAAYPEFGCKSNYRYQVKTTWGGFPDIICPSEESIKFLYDVIDEVIDLFGDSPYIHIGGDEVDLTQWESSKLVKEIMRMHDLGSPQDVLAWLLGKIEDHVRSRGKKLLGWEEVLQGKISLDAAIMSWKGLDSAIRSTTSYHDTIVCPDSTLYFDRPQGNPAQEPLALGRPTTLRDVYEFEPIPANIPAEEARYIIGAEGCVWTEFIKNQSEVEYMAFPRAIALAEVVWSPAKNRTFEGFISRLETELVRLGRENVNYRVPEPFKLRNIPK